MMARAALAAERRPPARRPAGPAAGPPNVWRRRRRRRRRRLRPARPPARQTGVGGGGDGYCSGPAPRGGRRPAGPAAGPSIGRRPAAEPDDARRRQLPGPPAAEPDDARQRQCRSGGGAGPGCGEGQGSLGASAWAGERWRGGSSGRDPWRGRAQSRGRRRRAVAGRAGPGGRGRVHSGGRRGRARPGRAGEAAHGRASERGRTGAAERRSGRARTRGLEFTEQTGKNHSLLFIMSRMIGTVSLVIGRPAASARSIAALILRCISGVMALA